MSSVSKECDVCSKYYGTEADGTVVLCPQCGEEELSVFSGDWPFKRCPCCESHKFYRRKDFNQIIGCLIILVGAIFVPFTYGLSLIALSLLDYLLYRKVPELLICYKCGAEFRGFGPLPEDVAVFDHHIGELYEK